MGACEFTSVAYGKTPAEAFGVAHEQATWDHGHAGYSGTIAEKPGFILFDLPPRTTVAQVQEKAWDAQSCIWWDEETERAKVERREPQRYHHKKPTAKQRAALKWMRDRFGARTEKLLWALDNKWDECAAFELRGAEKERAKAWAAGGPPSKYVDGKWVTPRTTKKIYMFVGFASC